MNDKKIAFLLKYAEIGVLSSMEKANPIKVEELKQEYLEIKKELSESQETVKQKAGSKAVAGKEGEGAMKTWFKGIGNRQRKYQETHKGELM